MTEPRSSTHLLPPVSGQGRPGVIDFACPGLMLAANVSLVLGYLWIGWFSLGDGAGSTLTFVRDVILPVLVTALVLVVRKASHDLRIPGSGLLLPLLAVVQLLCSFVAGARGSRSLELAAGVVSLAVAATAIGCVFLRERTKPQQPELRLANAGSEEPPVDGSRLHGESALLAS